MGIREWNGMEWWRPEYCRNNCLGVGLVTPCLRRSRSVPRPIVRIELVISMIFPHNYTTPRYPYLPLGSLDRQIVSRVYLPTNLAGLQIESTQRREAFGGRGASPP